jgi:phage I-like protein
MADAIYIDTSSFKKGTKAFGKLINSIPGRVNKVLNASAEEVEERAKQRAPRDRGPLAQLTKADTSKHLEKHITVNVPYAAYVEFGTGKYAAQYVSTLEAKYKNYAAQFKGKGGGDYYEFLNAILDWVKRHKLAQITNSYTGRKRTKKEDLLLVAETIAWSIIKNGIHPHPFLIPSLIEQEPILKRDMETMLKSLHV